MTLAGSFIAVDWGTTNRRVYLIEDGQAVRTEREDRGVIAVGPDGFEAEAADIRARFGDFPMLLAGMVGSTLGWRTVPYADAPAGIRELVAGLLWVDNRTVIVPGISAVVQGRPDVMRGEEVQLLGAVGAGLAPADALLCQPGTHCKWVEMERGRVARFTTAMTGELFALLRAHSLLAGQLGGEVTVGDAFLDGVVEGRKGDLAASLFGIRAAKLLGLRHDNDAASFASGLLIGSDVAVRLADARHDVVHVLADPALGALYAAAIECLGRETVQIDSQAAFVSGSVEIGARIA